MRRFYLQVQNYAIKSKNVYKLKFPIGNFQKEFADGLLKLLANG